MDLLRQDFRYALRRIARSPGFTLVAALSLALGIGANTAIFSIVSAFLLRDLHVAEPARLMEVYTSDDEGIEHAVSSYADYVDLRAQTTDVFDDVVAYELFFGQVQGPRDEEPFLAMGELVTGNYFDVLGVHPALGRSFLPEEDATPGTHPVIVVSHGFWQRALGGESAVIGHTLRLNRRPYTIVGVAPEEFRGMTAGIVPDMWVPMMMVGTVKPTDFDRLTNRGSRSLLMKARLRPGVDPAGASAAVAAVGQRLAASYPQSNEDRRMSAIPTTDVSIHPVVDKALLPVAALLMTVVGLVLMIACVNLASFLLARAADRRREIAIRLAIGAKRFHLMRQLLIESVLLSLLGGAAGVLLAQWTVRLLTGFQPPIPIPLNLDFHIDGTVLAFTFAISVVAGIGFGLLPALHATRPDVAPTLKSEAGNVTAERRRFNLRNGLVVTQVAVSLVLLIGSGLFLRSLRKAQEIDPGFDTGPAAILWPNLEMSGVSDEASRPLYARLREAILATPGVTEVAMADRLPLGFAIQTRGINIDGVEPSAGQDALHVDFTHVDSDYFAVMDVPIVAGRNFSAADAAGSPTVAIISEAMARRFWANTEAIGKHFYPGDRNAPVTVIGIARDTRVRTLGEAPRPYFYLHAPQHAGPELLIVVRGSLPAGELLAAARRTALEIEPNLVVFDAKTMEQHLALFLFPPRMAALLLSTFGGLALLLAAVGLYGVISYTVSRRAREMGIRMALGAQPHQLVTMVTAAGLRLVGTGAAIGIVLAATVTSLIARFLYGIRAMDFVTFAGVPLLLIAVGLFATWLPARRASRSDPVAALRSE
jgi:predicted permease